MTGGSRRVAYKSALQRLRESVVLVIGVFVALAAERTTGDVAEPQNRDPSRFTVIATTTLIVPLEGRRGTLRPPAASSRATARMGSPPLLSRIIGA